MSLARAGTEMGELPEEGKRSDGAGQAGATDRLTHRFFLGRLRLLKGEAGGRKMKRSPKEEQGWVASRDGETEGRVQQTNAPPASQAGRRRRFGRRACRRRPPRRTRRPPVPFERVGANRGNHETTGARVGSGRRLAGTAAAAPAGASRQDSEARRRTLPSASQQCTAKISLLLPGRSIACSTVCVSLRNSSLEPDAYAWKGGWGCVWFKARLRLTARDEHGDGKREGGED